MKKLFTTALSLATALVFSQNKSDFSFYTTEAKGAKTAEKLMESLIGEGVVLKSFSISKTTNHEAFGFFEDKNKRLGMNKGLIMTTGGIVALASKNSSGSMSNQVHRSEERRGQSKSVSACKEIEELVSGKKTFDACIIELDIVPTADTLSFNYVFGSEEYDEFVGSNYNDAFAFFITGKGIEKRKNLAVLPGSNIPVSVNTINNGSSKEYRSKTPSNPDYYIGNTDGHILIEYDGMTKLMEIKQPVTPNETYHLKLAIADVGDDAYDSGVLIEGHSFVSYKKTYNVFFKTNANEPEEGYSTLLKNLAKEYKNSPDGKIIITGHTDNEGDFELNQKLSCERANEVAKQFTEFGVPQEKLVVLCKGESMPAYQNTNELNKGLNRRVEIKFAGNQETYAAYRADSIKPNTIDEEKSALIKNFPNPFIGQTKLQAYVKNGVKSAQIQIKDINGKHIKTIFLMERENTEVTFDGLYLSKGIYFATLITDGTPLNTLKLVLQ